MLKYILIGGGIGVYLCWTAFAWGDFISNIIAFKDSSTIKEIFCWCEWIQVWLVIHLLLLTLAICSIMFLIFK